MKRAVYVAGCLERRAEADAAAHQLRAAGHAVTSRWHADPANCRELEATLAPACPLGTDIAAANYDDLREARAVLWLADARSRGALCEVGFALGRGMAVAAVGDGSGITLMAASAPGVVWFASVAAAALHLNGAL